MERPYLLHMLTPTKNVSPFDVNLAYDAGWDAVTGYTNVAPEEVEGLVQDAIFSRGPKGVRRTALFIGGRDINIANDMLETAKASMVPPFEISAFADPSGAFTTAAAMVACVEKGLQEAHGAVLRGAQVAVFGTGPVGITAGVLAARAGARVTLVSHCGAEQAREAASECESRYGVSFSAGDGTDDDHKREVLADTDVVLCAARAGVQILSEELVRGAKALKVAGDVNAVPPLGVEGVGVHDSGEPIAGTEQGAIGIGALAIGDVKYKTQYELLQRMRMVEEPQNLGFDAAFDVARNYVSSR